MHRALFAVQRYFYWWGNGLAYDAVLLSLAKRAGLLPAAWTLPLDGGREVGGLRPGSEGCGDAEEEGRAGDQRGAGLLPSR